MNFRERARRELNNINTSNTRIIDDIIAGVDKREALAVFFFLPGFLIGVELAIQSELWVLASVNRTDFYSDLIGQQLLSMNTLVESYLSSIAHSGWDKHLKPNLISYLLCMTALYPLAALSDRKKTFAGVFLLILIIAPIASTGFSIVFPMGPRSIGFSGVVSSFYGVLPVVMFSAIDSYTDADINPRWSIMVIFSVYASILVYVGSIPIGVFCLGIAGLSLFGMIHNVGLGGVIEVVNVALGFDHLPFFWATMIATVGAIGMYYNLPQGVNVVSHIAGYMIGFLIGFLVLSDHTISRSRASEADKQCP